MNISFSGVGISGSGNTGPRLRTQASPLVGLIIGAIVIIVGFVVGGFAISAGNHDSRIINNGEQVQGTVTDVYQKTSKSTSSTSRQSSSSKRSTSEYVTISYIVDGRQYDMKKSQTTKNMNFEPTVLNSAVTVYYDADKPGEGVVKGWEASPIFGYAFGGFFVLMGSIVSISSARRLFS